MKGIFLLFCYFYPTLHSSVSTYSNTQPQRSNSSGASRTVTIYDTLAETISTTNTSVEGVTNILTTDSISISDKTTTNGDSASQTKFPNTVAISPTQETLASFIDLTISTTVSRGNTTVTSNFNSGTGPLVSTSKGTTSNIDATLIYVPTSPSTVFAFSSTTDLFRATSQSIKSASTVHTYPSATTTTPSQKIPTTTTHSSYSMPSVSVTSHASLSSSIINSKKSFTLDSSGNSSNTKASTFKGSMTLPQPTRSLTTLFASSSINQRPGSSGKTSGSTNGKTTSKHSSYPNETFKTGRTMVTATTTASMKSETISATLAIVGSVNSSNTTTSVTNQLLSSSSTASSQNELSSGSNAGTQSFLKTETIVYTNTILSTKAKQVAQISSMMTSSMVKQTMTTNKTNIMMSSTPSLEPSNAVPGKMMSSTIKPSIFIQPTKTTTVMMTSLTMTLHTNTTTVPTTANITLWPSTTPSTTTVPTTANITLWPSTTPSTTTVPTTASITLWPSTTPSTTTVTTTVNITLLPTTVSTTQRKVESTSSSRDNTIYTPSSSVASGQCPCSSRTWKYPEDCRNMCCAGGYINATRVCMMNSVAITDSLCGKNRTSEMPCGKVNECACKGSQLSSFSYMAVTFLALVVWR